MKKIDISTPKFPNTFTEISDIDFTRVSQWKWFADEDAKGNIYVSGNIKQNDEWKKVPMHRFIMGLAVGDKRQVDHRKHTPLDNQRENLRICTPQQNQFNRKPCRWGSSKYKGVSYAKDRGKWQVHIRADGKITSLGRFKSETEAAKAYDKVARELHGEYAYLNFPDEIAIHLQTRPADEDARSVPMDDPCPDCDGRGDLNWCLKYGYQMCPTCKGTGIALAESRFTETRSQIG